MPENSKIFRGKHRNIRVGKALFSDTWVSSRSFRSISGRNNDVISPPLINGNGIEEDGTFV